MIFSNNAFCGAEFYGACGSGNLHFYGLRRCEYKIQAYAEKLKAHNQCEAYCHVRIAGKIAINLSSIAEDTHQRFKSVVAGWCIKNKVVVLANIVGNNCLNYFTFIFKSVLIKTNPSTT